MIFLIAERVLRYSGKGRAKAWDQQQKPDKFTLITGLDFFFFLAVMITNRLHSLPRNKADTPSLENFKSSLSVFSMRCIYEAGSTMLQRGGRGQKLPDEIGYSASRRKITQEIPSAYQTQHLSLVACSDRISVLLKSTLTHYLFFAERQERTPKNEIWKVWYNLSG